jgi:predicted Zn finger-like uncharacterized protein
MIAACPKCGTRFRIDANRLRPEGARLRCSRCEAVFRVLPPAQRAAGERTPEGPAGASSAQRAADERSRGEARPSESPARAAEAPPMPAPDLVLADGDVDRGRAMANTLVAWGLRPLLVHDGVEAILAIQRSLPAFVILDAALPKMFGFQVCELIKRNESLRHIRVVLIGAIHHRERYRRAPSELYGADAYVEGPDLPDGLRPILRDLGVLAGTDAPAAAPATGADVPGRTATPTPGPPAVARSPGPAPEPRAATPTAAPPPPPAAASAGAATDEQVAEAERLARIIVSDVVLYNEEKFAAAVRSGNVVEALEAELQEGRAHFDRRIDAQVRQARDFLAEELLRVARTRGTA